MALNGVGGSTKFSIITSAKNDVEALMATEKSIAGIEYENFEWIVIDSDSNDGTKEFLQASKTVTKFLSERDEGIYDAWNKGVKLASGDYISFLGAGDHYTFDSLSSYNSEVIRSNAEPDYLSSKVRYAKGLEIIGEIGQKSDYHQMSKYMRVAHVGSMHHKRLFEKIGLYDQQLKIVGDYELLLRAGDSMSSVFINEVTATMQAGGASWSIAALREAREVKVNGGHRSVFMAGVDYYLARLKFVLNI